MHSSLCCTNIPIQVMEKPDYSTCTICNTQCACVWVSHKLLFISNFGFGKTCRHMLRCSYNNLHLYVHSSWKDTTEWRVVKYVEKMEHDLCLVQGKLKWPLPYYVTLKKKVNWWNFHDDLMEKSFKNHILLCFLVLDQYNLRDVIKYY